MYNLRNVLASHVGVIGDQPHVTIMSVRASHYGRLTTLIVNLYHNSYSETVQIIMMLPGTPAATLVFKCGGESDGDQVEADPTHRQPAPRQLRRDCPDCCDAAREPLT